MHYPADHQVKSKQLFAALEIRRERERGKREGETDVCVHHVTECFQWLVRPFQKALKNRFGQLYSLHHLLSRVLLCLSVVLSGDKLHFMHCHLLK